LGSTAQLVLVCDFDIGLLHRILAVYEHFSEKPRVLLIKKRRGSLSKRDAFSKIEIPLRADVDASTPVRMFGAVVRASVYLFYVFLLLPSIARNRPINVVHAHYLLPQGLAGALIARAVKAPLILTATGTDMNILAKRRIPRWLMRRVLFQNASLIIAVSQGILKEVQNLGCHHAIYLPNCVEIDKNRGLEQSLNAHNIIFVGSLTKLKRPHVLIQAFRRVADEVPDATLTIAGKGPLRQSLEDMTSRLHLTEKVTFAGYIEGEKVVQLYREASVFVLPSAAEGLSLALLEAMSFGKCVVVSERAHSGVIQDRVDGLIFRFDDADDLAGKLLWIFENPERSKRLSVNARQKVEREYSLEAIAPRLEQLYGEVAGVTSQ